MKLFAKYAFLIALLAAPVLLFGDSERETLAVQIEQRLVDVTPNTVYIVVDEATKTAYLRGTASQAEIDRITELVRSIDGVRVVGSTVVVAEPGPYDEIVTTQTVEVDPPVVVYEDMPVEVRTVIAMPDASLRAAVEEALKLEGIVGQSKIKVETEDGLVTLTGTALSQAHADRIVALAMSVPGVAAVEPNIVLRDEKRVYQVKPSGKRDKEGREVGDGLSRVPDTREGDVDIDIDLEDFDEDDER